MLEHQNLWVHLEDGVLKACDKVCGKKMGGKVKEIHGGGVNN